MWGWILNEYKQKINSYDISNLNSDTSFKLIIFYWQLSLDFTSGNNALNFPKKC